MPGWRLTPGLRHSHSGPPAAPGSPSGPPPGQNDTDGGASFQEQDINRRLGDYGGTGEHLIPQPGRLNDGDIHSK